MTVPFFFLAFETLDLAMQEVGEFKAEELQMVYIDFHENWVSLSEDQSLSALRGLEDKPVIETDDISNAQR